MKLNLEFYREEKESSEEERKIINEYIEKIANCATYEEKISPMPTDKEVYYLSSCSQNILNWYPFKEEDTILEIGGDLGQLTGIFTKQCKEVVTIEPNLIKGKAIGKKYEKEENLEIIVGDLTHAKIEKKFDYIVLIGSVSRVKEIMGQDMKLTQMLQQLENYLKEDGKYLVAVDNKFGLRYFVGNPDNVLNEKFKIINGYNNELEKIETFTKTRLERKLKEIGYYTNFYYPLPDYKIPNVIFSDKQLPDYRSVDKYNAYYTENSDVLMNEIDVFREILKNNEEMFTFFANSFLMEISKREMPIKYQYISFNNMRKEQYRLLTKIAEDYVEKQAINEISQKHYDGIKKNIKYMNENHIKTLDYEVEGKIQSKYISQELLLNHVITKALESGDDDLLEKFMKQYIEVLNKDTYQENNYENTVFAKYGIDIENKEIIKQLHFQKKGLWDMTFKNCFYIEGELYFFDQEWEEENLPAEYILYRSILYTISLRRFINIEDWFKKYNLEQYKELFQKLDDKLQEKIRDEKMWKFYSQNKNFNIDETKQELANREIRSQAQQAAIENLQKEKEQIQKEYEDYRKIQESRMTNRVRRKIKRMIGRKES